MLKSSASKGASTLARSSAALATRFDKEGVWVTLSSGSTLSK